MAEEKKQATNDGVEWRINVGDGSSKVLVEEEGPVTRAWLGVKCSILLKIWSFFKKAWDVAVDDPRKVVHGLKVGMSLTIVTLFYFMRPLYEGVGGNAMWAIMTVVVVSENTAGATICKSLNRVCGTSLAGMLGFGVNWLATQSGEKYEPFIVGASVFIIASAATFARFIPSVKERFDYGTMIFVLTFSLVAISGYRVDKLLELTRGRISTIIIGTSLAIIVTMLICPIWAGGELYTLIISNMDKLANSLDGCVAKYFNQSESDKMPDKNLVGYKCVLGSKAREESLANFARWEPAHGRFGFKHPWKQYPKIGASMRNCASCIGALTTYIDSEIQAPEIIKNQLSNPCLRVASLSSNVIRELTETIKTMKRSSTIEFLVEEMSSAVEELQESLNSLSNLFNSPNKDTTNSPPEETDMTNIPLTEIISALTFASLLVDIATRIKTIAGTVEELAKLADFKVNNNVDHQEKCKENQASNKKLVPDQLKIEESMKTLPRLGRDLY